MVHCPESQTNASKIVSGSSSKVTFGIFSDAQIPHHILNKNGLEGNNAKWIDPSGRGPSGSKFTSSKDAPV